MSKTTPEQVKAAGKRLIDSASKRMTQYLADLSVERQAITADNLSREVLIELLAVARVNLRNAKADKESASEQHHRNSEAHWEHADKLAVKRERKNVQGKSGEGKDTAKAEAWIKQKYRENFNQYTFKNGKPNKSAFIREYANKPGVYGRMKTECPYGGRNEDWVKEALKGLDPLE